MSILTLIVVFVAVGVALLAINKYVPMQSTVKTIMNVVVILFLIWWVAKGVGLIDWLSEVRV